MNERRIVEETTENDIKELNEFYESSIQNDKNSTNKKTLIARITIKWKKKQLNNTEIKPKQNIVNSIQEKMAWENFKSEEQTKENLPQLPISNKSGDEVLKMKKKSYQELQIATQEVENVLHSSAEDTLFDDLFPDSEEEAINLITHCFDMKSINKEDRDMLIELYGEDIVKLAEQQI